MGRRTRGRLVLTVLVIAMTPGGVRARRSTLEEVSANVQGCWVQLHYRPLHFGVLDVPPNHTYLLVSDDRALRWVLEGRPEFSVPQFRAERPWGRVRAFSTPGNFGYESTDDALTDLVHGKRRVVACEVIDRLQKEVAAFDAETRISYYPVGPNSNTFTHWLLQRTGLDSFGEPPAALNWSLALP